MTSTTADETLRMNNGDFDDSTRALLFGELVRRAKSLVTHYESDLYHDARWLATYVNGAQSWYWIVRPSGTHIGEDANFMAYAARSVSGALWYRITVRQDPRTDVWLADFELVTSVTVN